MNSPNLKIVSDYDIPSDDNLVPIEVIDIGRRPSAIRHDFPEMVNIDPAELHVDHTFQRNISEAGRALIRAMVADWSWAIFTPPLIYVTGGKYVVVDGQHTSIAALSHPHIKEIPCIVCKTIESLKEAAEVFVDRNTHRLNVHMLQRYKASLVAGEEWATELHRMSEEVKFRIPFQPDHNPPADTVLAIKTMKDMFETYGYQKLKQAMKILVGNNFRPIRDSYIKAIVHLLSAQEYRKAVRIDFLTTLMKTIDHNKLFIDTIGEAAVGGVTKWEMLAVKIFREYQSRYPVRG